MSLAWEQIEHQAQRVLGNSAYAAGVLANHLQMCGECKTGTRCAWANKLAQAAGDGRASLPEKAAGAGDAA